MRLRFPASIQETVPRISQKRHYSQPNFVYLATDTLFKGHVLEFHNTMPPWHSGEPRCGLDTTNVKKEPISKIM